MVPAQCPECGRFLAKAFVAGLAVSDATCPACGTTLTAAQFDGVDQSSGDDPAPEAAEQADVHAPDPLDGWDGPGVVDIEQWRTDHQRGPSDAAVVAGAAAAGLVVGLALGRGRPIAGALVGGLLGAAAGAGARRIWRLEG